MRSVLIRRVALAWLMLGPAPVMSSAQEMPAPVQLQFTLLMKVLSYDRAIQAREGDELRIGVLFQGKVRASVRAKDEFISSAQANAVSIGSKKVTLVPLDQSEFGDLRAVIDRKKIDVLYVTPLRLADVGVISTLTRLNRVLTLTGVPEFVEEGLSVGINLKGDKPQLEINLAAAKAEGADFSSQLLKVAKIIEQQ